MKFKDRLKICLRYQSFNQKAVEVLKKNIKNLSNGAFSFSSIRLPIKKKRLTLLRSPHVNKKSRDQLEIRLYNGLIFLSGNSLPSSFLKSINDLSNSEISLKVSILTSLQKIKC